MVYQPLCRPDHQDCLRQMCAWSWSSVGVGFPATLRSAPQCGDSKLAVRATTQNLKERGLVMVSALCPTCSGEVSRGLGMRTLMP